MLIVVTDTNDAVQSMRGKAMGWYVFRDREVKTLDVVTREPGDADPGRWPYGLLVYQAFSIREPPVFKAFLPAAHARYPGRVAATAYGELTPEEEALVDDLASDEARLPPRVEIVQSQEWARANGIWLSRPGPPSSATSYVVNRTRSGGATYVLLWREQSVAKIGWAKDVHARTTKLSESLAPHLTGQGWTIIYQQQWSDDRIAYAMEQEFIALSPRYGFKVEREYFRTYHGDAEELRRLWEDAWLKVRQADVDTLPPAEPKNS